MTTKCSCWLFRCPQRPICFLSAGILEIITFVFKVILKKWNLHALQRVIRMIHRLKFCVLSMFHWKSSFGWTDWYLILLKFFKTSKLSAPFISWVKCHCTCLTAVLPENSLSNRFLLREIFEEFKKKFKTMENKERMKGKKSVI